MHSFETFSKNYVYNMDRKVAQRRVCFSLLAEISSGLDLDVQAWEIFIKTVHYTIYFFTSYFNLNFRGAKYF